MERLTNSELGELARTNTWATSQKAKAIREDIRHKDNVTFERLYARLAELEDKIEKGILIELPCKVGDTVYIITLVDKSIKQSKVTGILLKNSGVIVIFDNYAWLLEDAFGDRVFLSKEEAERRLAELRGEK